MKQIFPKVWFATEKLVNSPTRVLNYSDYGSLSFESGKLQFDGRKLSIRTNNIQSVDLIYARVPWITLLGAIIALIVFLGFRLSSSSEPMETILLVLPLLCILMPFLFVVQKVTLWIEIVFLDNTNLLHRAYFLDGSHLGWGGIFGGTLEMYKRIKLLQEGAG